MKRLILTSLLFTSIVSSCASNEAECTDCEQAVTDTLSTPEDDIDAALKNDTVTRVDVREQKANHEKIVKKYGEQWDFCTCVVANDSITDAFEKKLTPAQEEKLMARWDYVDKKCKELTTAPSTTPEERAKHDKRVSDCLKKNGLRK